jgi:hypothetical protein
LAGQCCILRVSAHSGGSRVAEDQQSQRRAAADDPFALARGFRQGRYGTPHLLALFQKNGAEENGGYRVAQAQRALLSLRDMLSAGG